MNVYRIDTFSKPAGTKFKYYAHLEGDKSDDDLLEWKNFAGCPFPKKWRRIGLHFDEPRRPRADFYHLSGTGSAFVCSERVRELAGHILKSCGEFLPVELEGEDGAYYLHNVTSVGAFMDEAKSVFETPSNAMKAALKAHLDAGKTFNTLVAPAFLPDAIKKQTVFKIPQLPHDTYVAETDHSESFSAFKALVERNNLVGLRFMLAWNETGGPKPLKFPTLAGGSKWVYGDGREFPNWKGYKPL